MALYMAEEPMKLTSWSILLQEDNQRNEKEKAKEAKGGQSKAGAPGRFGGPEGFYASWARWKAEDCSYSFGTGELNRHEKVLLHIRNDYRGLGPLATRYSSWSQTGNIK